MFAEIKSIMNLLKREKLKCIQFRTIRSSQKTVVTAGVDTKISISTQTPPPPSREITVHFTSSAATESKSRLYALTSSQRIPLVPGLHKHFPVARSQLSVFLGLQSHR